MNEIPNYLVPFMQTVAKHDLFGEVFWHSDFKFVGINCNDVFYWGCADLEAVSSLEDVQLLDECCEKSKYDGAMLYCAKKRKMRPQGAMYKHIDEGDRSLFNECGPERDIDFANPQAQDGEYLYKDKPVV